MSKAQPSLDQNAEACEHTFCDSPIRSEVWQIADRIFSRGMRLVDIGCGTGEDAIHFASRGINVTAVDVSAAMIAQLKSKSGGAVRCEVGDMRTCPVEDVFDGVFSNFSALNYVPDLDWLGRIRLTPGAHLVFTTLGRFYPLESAVFMFKGQPRRAFRRFKPSFRGEVSGVNFNVYYHSLRKIRNALGRGARLKQVLGLRALSPTPELAHLERFEVLSVLRSLDRWWCSHRPTAALADQFLSVWQLPKTPDILERGSPKLYPSTNDGSGSVQFEVYNGMVISPRGANILRLETSRPAREIKSEYFPSRNSLIPSAASDL